MRPLTLLSCLGIFAACGDRSEVVINVPNTQALFVEYKTQDAWNKPALSSDGYHFSTDSAYEFVVVCTDSHGSADVEMLFATPDDGPQTVVPVLSNGGCQTAASPALGTVTGHAVQAGELSIATVGTGSVSSNWTFDLLAPVGTYDAVMVNEPTSGPLRASVRRNVEVTTDTQTSLAPFDLDTEGNALIPIATNTISGMSNELVSQRVILKTANGTSAVISEVDEPPALGLDSSATIAGDVQLIRVQADADMTSRSAIVPITGSAVTIQLPELITPTYSDSAVGVHVGWSQDLPSEAQVDVSVEDAGGDVVHAVSSNGVSTSHKSIDVDMPNSADWQSQWSPSWLGNSTAATRVFSTKGNGAVSGSFVATVTTPPG